MFVALEKNTRPALRRRGGNELRKFLPVVTLLSVILLFLPVRGQEFSEIDTMSIGSYVGLPGDTLILSVDLVNTFYVAGFELRISYDTSAFEPLAVELAERAFGFEQFGSNFTEPGTIGFFALSMHPRDNAFPPGNGAIANIMITIKETALPGGYDFEFISRDNHSYNNSLSDTNSVLIIPVLEDGIADVNSPTGISDLVSTPLKFDLGQNYPNPFNMTTVISFYLEQSGHVDLEIYDIVGRKVATVYSGLAKAGESNISWDGNMSADGELASGVFFYKLKTTWGESVTKRMTLLK